MTAIADQLSARGIDVEELAHEPAHSARAEAARLGLPPEAVAKTIVLDTAGRHALAVVQASDRLDMALVHRALGDPHARLASEEELRRDYPQYDLGTFPPLGTLMDAPVYVDPRVMGHEEIIFAAGTSTASVKARTDELFRGEQPVVAPLVREYEEGKEPLAP
jgi:prolyl-tRNA editing enzyme YbaK/EbsC (Cys-tRNA(Pro) deacylase)